MVGAVIAAMIVVANVVVLCDGEETSDCHIVITVMTVDGNCESLSQNDIVRYQCNCQYNNLRSIIITRHAESSEYTGYW